MQPRLFGALLDAVAHSLRLFSRVHMNEAPSTHDAHARSASHRQLLGELPADRLLGEELLKVGNRPD